MLEHPEIGHIERTGYPSWMQEGEELEIDEDGLYEERREGARGNEDWAY
jgi:hypothetical protein